MSFSSSSRRWINDVEVRPGAVWREPLEQIRLQWLVECVSVSPDLFVGRAVLAGRPLLDTEALPDVHLAARRARELFLDRLVGLLAD